MEPKEAPVEASVPNLKETSLSLKAGRAAVGSPGNALAREGKEASFMLQGDAPCAPLQSKGKPDLESGAVSLQRSLGHWKILEPPAASALGELQHGGTSQGQSGPVWLEPRGRSILPGSWCLRPKGICTLCR